MLLKSITLEWKKALKQLALLSIREKEQAGTCEGLLNVNRFVAGTENSHVTKECTYLQYYIRDQLS